ncbi:T9SS type A sorting domain-containing protein [Flammeovirga sp. SubArs3]|uniref:T9SS type A sorting domain-containing protein n=1 Tax=Flammeovirga sp. SubArs3 TaxID=2995316 RepID=UPI00248C4B80|nr:T9SS type A sorting domain-containing protein [Flammeovirga sp. SubArs3]
MNVLVNYQVKMCSLVLFFLSLSGSAQTFDINYNSPTTLGTITDPLIDEASGLAASYNTENAFWLHNDSGDGPNLWLIDKSGAVLTHGIVKNKNGSNASSRDWEDISSFVMNGTSYLIIGNFGDNPINKSEYYLYIIEEPEYDPQSTSNNSYEILKTITYQYENGSQNCESIGVDVENEKIILVSKSSVGGNKIAYEIPLSITSEDITTTAKIIGQFPMDGTTAMDISNDGQHAIVLTYTDAYEFTRYDGTSWEDAFGIAPRKITMPQRNGGEAIAYGVNGIDLYLVREGKSSPVWELKGNIETGTLFQVDMAEKNDIYNKQVWVNIQGQGQPILMTDTDEDGIYACKVDLAVDKNYQYSFSYQNGTDATNDIIYESTGATCINDDGNREVFVSKQNLLLRKVLFSNCEERPNYYIIDECESLTGWNTNGLSLKNTDQKQGLSCIEFKGSSNVEFEKILTTPTHANGTEEGTVLEFWYYVSDPSLFEDSNQVEITSSGTSDVDEYSWSLDKANLVSGWNFLQLSTKDANKRGNPDLTAINYFRLYRSKTSEVTTRIDDIQLIGENNSFASDASLSLLTIEAGTLDPSFSPGILEYSVELPFGFNTIPSVTATANQDGKATVTITEAETMDETTTVVVTAEDGVTQRTYTISFYAALGKYLDECEVKDGWNPSILAINTVDQKQGEGCLEFSGTDDVEFVKNFTEAFDSNGSESNVKLSFWYYVSNVTALEDKNQVEISSSGQADVDEYSWSLDKNNLKVGWNYIELETSLAAKRGTPDLSAINFFRLYRGKTTNITTRIDAINLYGGIALSTDNSLSSLTVDNGTLSPTFSAEELNYTVILPSGTSDIPQVSATATDQNSSVQITQAATLDDLASVTVSAEDGSVRTYRISFEIGDPTSIDDKDMSIQIFPNPVTDLLSIQSNTVIQSILVLNVNGYLKYSQEIYDQAIQINTDQWEKGLYCLKVTLQNGQTIVRKIIK